MDRLNKLVSEGLKRQPVGPHPGADALAAFSGIALGHPERQQIVEHLAACADCREILYLAQPDLATTQPAVVYRPNRITHFVLRWGAVAASLVIVAGGLFITRHDFFLGKQKASQQPTPAYDDKLAEKKAPLEFDSVRNAEPPAAPKQLSAASTKTRPAEKHMTAKPQADMRFDESGQVRVLNERETAGEASGTDANGLIAQVDKKIKQRDDQASANAPSAAGAVVGHVAENRVAAKDMPSATSESVEVTSETPVVQTKREQVVGTGSAMADASQNDLQAFKQNGALFKTHVLPLAQWQLCVEGAVRRSFDSGKTWQSVVVDGNGTGFRAIFSSGAQVWVGGAAGALYHSTDSGLTWAKVVPATAGQKLQSDVSHIEFSDPETGAIITSNGETWMTSDGGQTWRRK